MKDKDNKLIALFMGLKPHHQDAGYLIDESKDQGYEAIHESCFLYDSSWDWLIPVVDEIESRGYWFNRIIGDVTIVDNDGGIVISTPYSVGGHDMYYKAVVEFIKIYNDEQ